MPVVVVVVVSVSLLISYVPRGRDRVCEQRTGRGTEHHYVYRNLVKFRATQSSLFAQYVHMRCVDGAPVFMTQ